MAQIIKRSFPVFGMTCASCAVSVESMLSKTAGVKKVAVNLADNTAMVEYDSDMPLTSLKTSLQSIGYDIDIAEHRKPEDVEAEREKIFVALKHKVLFAFALTVPVFVFGMFFHHYMPGRYISMVLSAVVVFYFGRQFFVTAVKQAKHKTAGMDTLVAISTGVSYLFSTFNTLFPQILLSKGLHPDVYFESAAVITSFILLGKYLEEKAKSGTSAAIKMLMGLQPKTVTKIQDNKELVISIEEVAINDYILIKPGEKVPVDGTVIDGSSYVNESMINGEPLPLLKQVSSNVFAGTLNQKGSLKIVAEKTGKNTMLGQIISAVQQAQGSKAPVQRMVDKIAAVFVPVVIVISLLTFIVWVAVGGYPHLLHGFISAVSVLVIACPCALGLATPTAIMVGVGKGAQNGILIRNVEALENARNIDVVLLDKTGTITEGKPEVSDFIWIKQEYSQAYATIISSIEKLSEHPLADAVVNYLNCSSTLPVGNFETITGKGVTAVVEQKKYLVGKEKWLKEKLVWITPELEARMNELRTQGKTVVCFSNEFDLLAIIGITDSVKSSSTEAIRQLSLNSEVVMLTGDSALTAGQVAAQTGIKEYYADLLPADKARFVTHQIDAGKKVAMVGDGINDSEALVLADISMAMGKGTDIAMSVADITLMQSDLLSVVKAIQLSKQIIATIRQNLFWAFIYNLIGIPLAAGVLYPFTGFQLDPMIASAAMALSSVSVVSNSLWLRTKKLH